MAYISLAPRYPAYTVIDAGGFPAAAAPGSQRPLSEAEWQRIQRWPKPEESLLATGRVVNYGPAPSGPFRYKWLLNGKTLAEGRHPGLAPRAEVAGPVRDWLLGETVLRDVELPAGTFVDLPQPLEWRKRSQRLRLEVRLESATAKEQEPPEDLDVLPRPSNNLREEQVDSLAFLVTVPRSLYNEWVRLPQPRRYAGFEDWVQNQFELLRTRFQVSAYPRAPEGVTQPVRVDQVRIVEDGQDLSALAAAAAPAGWDGYWSAESGRRVLEDAIQPTDLADPALSASLLAQLGVVDLGSLNLLPDAVRPGSNGAPVFTGYVHPVVPASASLPLPEHTVLALNRMLGKRRGFRGTYLLEVPRECRLRLLDNNGRTLPDAAIAVYQRRDGGISGEPIASGVSSTAGEFPLPDQSVPPVRTADGFTLRENPFGALHTSGHNGLLLVRLAARGSTEYHWLPVTLFNQAYWSGQTRQATFDLRTRIPGVVAPPPVAGLQAAGESRAGQEGALVQWRAPEEPPAGYVVYRAAYPTYAWEKLSALTFVQTRFFDGFASRHPVRYAVTAVSLDGNESGLAEVVLPPSTRLEP